MLHAALLTATQCMQQGTRPGPDRKSGAGQGPARDHDRSWRINLASAFGPRKATAATAADAEIGIGKGRWNSQTPILATMMSPGTGQVSQKYLFLFTEISIDISIYLQIFINIQKPPFIFKGGTL